MMNVQNVFTVLCIVGFVLVLAACINALVSCIKLKRLHKRFVALLSYPCSTDEVPYYGGKTMLFLEYAALAKRKEAIVRKILEEDPTFVFSKSSMSEYNPGDLWYDNFCKKMPRSSNEGKPAYFDYLVFCLGERKIFHDEQRFEGSEDKPEHTEGGDLQ